MDARSKLLTYPESPRPCMLDAKSKLLIYPDDPKPCVEDTNSVIPPPNC